MLVQEIYKINIYSNLKCLVIYFFIYFFFSQISRGSLSCQVLHQFLSGAKAWGSAITGRNEISFFIDVNTCFLNWNSCSALLLSKMSIKVHFTVPSRGQCGYSSRPDVCVCVCVSVRPPSDYSV